jgi:hypothetical protein
MTYANDVPVGVTDGAQETVVTIPNRSSNRCFGWTSRMSFVNGCTRRGTSCKPVR